MASQKRRPKRLIGVIIAISSLFIVNAVFGILHTFRVSSANMYPTLPPGTYIWGTEIQKVKKGDLVFYQSTFGIKPKPTQTIQIVSRLIATADDTVVLKNGFAWVNGKMVDKGYQPACRYMIPSSLYGQHKSDILPDKYAEIPDLKPFYLPPDRKQVSITCPTDVLYGIAGSEVMPMDAPAAIQYLNSVNDDILPDYRKNLPEGWTMLNWGPYIVEADEVFILGDNRSGSEDSRHRKISKGSLKGVIW